MLISEDSTKDVLCISKVDPCGVCGLRVKANLAMCVQCGKWIHGRCAIGKRVAAKLSRNSLWKKSVGNIGEAMEQEE